MTTTFMITCDSCGKSVDVVRADRWITMKIGILEVPHFAKSFELCSPGCARLALESAVGERPTIRKKKRSAA